MDLLSFPVFIGTTFHGSVMVFLSTLDLKVLNPLLSLLIKHYLELQSIYFRAEDSFLYLTKFSAHEMADVWLAWQSHKRLPWVLDTFAFMSFYFHKNKEIILMAGLA